MNTTATPSPRCFSCAFGANAYNPATLLTIANDPTGTFLPGEMVYLHDSCARAAEADPMLAVTFTPEA